MVKLPMKCDKCGRENYHYASCNCTPPPITSLDLRQHGDNLRRVIEVVSELDTDFDRQLYDELKKEKYDDEPDDSEFSVNITVGQLRRLTIAALAAQALLSKADGE